MASTSASPSLQRIGIDVAGVLFRQYRCAVGMRVLIGQIPTVLRSELYAIPALVAAAITVAAIRLEIYGLAAALGAAMLAGVGSGVMPSIATAARELVQFDRTFEPDGTKAVYYGDKYAKYRELYEALKAFNG